jgi:hypothetical protein
MDRRLVCLCAALLGGCAPGNPGLYIANVISLNDQCAADVSNDAISSGILDVSSTQVRYAVSLRMLNQLISLGEDGRDNPPMADPNLVSLREVEVELRDISGAPISVGVNPYVVPANGFVPSSAGMTIGEGIGAAEIIPPQVGAGLTGLGDATIVAVIRAVGVTAGDAELVSPEFHFPITLCDGCLYACQLDEEMMPECNPTCGPGQDFVHTSPAACGLSGDCSVGSGS